MPVVLDAQLVENNEPSESDVLEYAKWLGMTFPEDEPFIWIAREGLKAPLPENWSACRSKKGDLYYFNLKTGQSIWDHPLDDHFRGLYRKEKQSSGFQSVSKNDEMRSIDSVAVTEGMSPKRKDVFCSSSKVSALKLLKLKQELSEDPGVNVKEPLNAKSDFSDQNAELVEVTECRKGTSHIDHKIINIVGDPCVTDDKFIESRKTDENEKAAVMDKLNFQFQEFQVEMLKEHHRAKEVYEQKLKNSLIWSKSRLDSKYKKKAVDYENDLSTKFLAEKQRLEVEFSENIQQLNDKLTKEFQEESERIQRQLIERQEKMKAEVEERWSLQIGDMERRFKEEKSDLKNQKDDELKTYFDQRALEFENLQGLQNDGIEILKGYSEEVKRTAALFIETCREAYVEFADVLQHTQNSACEVGERLVAQLSHEMRQMCDTELIKVKSYYDSEVSRIRKLFGNELVAMSAVHEDPVRTTREESNSKPEVHGLMLEAWQTADQKSKHDVTPSSTKSLTNAPSTMVKLDGPEVIRDRLDNNNPQNKNISGLSVSLRNERNLVHPNINLVRAEKNALSVHGVSHSSEEEEEVVVVEEGGNIHFGSVSEKEDSHKDGKESLRGLEGVPAASPVCIDFLKGKDLTAVITDALRKVFTGSPLIVSPTSVDSSVKQRCVLDLYSTSVSEAITNKKPRKMEMFPVSFQDQKLLLVSERQRILEGKKFVETQRLRLKKRREQLKVTRRQWKQDVITAKGEGVRPSSRQGQILNGLRAALEKQLKGLEQDENIIRDSELWLLFKEQQLHELEQHITDLEKSKVPNISINTIDTTALVTDYFKPSRGRYTRTRTTNCPKFRENTVEKTDPKALSPIYNIELNRIARRLDEVTSMVNLRNRKQSRQQYKKQIYQQKGGSARGRHSERKLAKRNDFDFLEIQSF